MDNCENWADDVLKMPVMKWVEKGHPDFGFMLTDSFGQVAKENGLSYVSFQFEKGNPDRIMTDSVNCTPAEFEALLEKLNEKKEDK